MKKLDRKWKIRITAFVICLVAVCGALTAWAVSPTYADTEGCTSHAEYDNMERYLTVQQVANRFDVPGWFISQGDSYWKRGYRTCWDYDGTKVVVWYDNDSGLSADWTLRDF